MARPFERYDVVYCRVPDGPLVGDLYVVANATRPSSTGYQELTVIGKDSKPYHAGAWQFALVEVKDLDALDEALRDAMADMTEKWLRELCDMQPDPCTS
jgi:hypothetical protein